MLDILELAAFISIQTWHLLLQSWLLMSGSEGIKSGTIEEPSKQPFITAKVHSVE